MGFGFLVVWRFGAFFEVWIFGFLAYFRRLDFWIFGGLAGLAFEVEISGRAERGARSSAREERGARRPRSEERGERAARSEAREERGARRARSEERGEGGARSEASEGGVRSEGRGRGGVLSFRVHGFFQMGSTRPWTPEMLNAL